MRPFQIRNVSSHIIPSKTNRSLFLIRLSTKEFQLDSDDLERAEAFNDYFKSIYKDHTCCSPPDLCPVNSNTNELLELIQVTPEDVFSLLFNLDVSKLLDRINYQLLS